MSFWRAACEDAVVDVDGEDAKDVIVEGIPLGPLSSADRASAKPGPRGHQTQIIARESYMSVVTADHIK